MARILIIEDDDEVRQLLGSLLARSGHEVVEAVDGRDGIHRFRTDPADLVITDLIMPRKEGLETIVELRREHPDLRIIAISGGSRDGRENYLNAAQLCGASLIFSKPFDNRDLLAAVDRLLGSAETTGGHPSPGED